MVNIRASQISPKRNRFNEPLPCFRATPSLLRNFTTYDPVCKSYNLHRLVEMHDLEASLVTFSLDDRLHSEGQLALGLWRGVENGAYKAVTNVAPLAIGIGTSLLAYRFGAYTKVGALALEAAGKAFNIAALTDATQWLGRTGITAIDTWRNPDHLQENIKISEQLGTEAFNTGAMFGAASLGYGLAKFKTPFDLDIRNVFNSVGPNAVPRLQTGLFGPKASIEPADSELGQFYKQYSPAVGRLSRDGSGGTAVLVAQKDDLAYWMTNWHLAEGKGAVAISHGDLVSEGMLVGGDPKADVAVFATAEVPGIEPVKLAATGGTFSPIDAVTIGHQKGSAVSMLSAVKSRRLPLAPDSGDDLQNDGSLRQNIVFTPTSDGRYVSSNVTSEYVHGGGSGMPIFNRSTGELLGIVSASTERQGIGVSVEHLRPILDAATADNTMILRDEMVKLSTGIHLPNGTLAQILAQPVRVNSSSIINADSVLNAEDLLYPSDNTDFFQLHSTPQAARLAATLDLSDQVHNWLTAPAKHESETRPVERDTTPRG